MIEIKIKAEYAKLVPQLSEGEYNELKQSIKENGLWSPIIINKNGYILDGHHRYRICRELGISPNIIVKIFDDQLQEKLFVIDSNLTRRQLSEFARIEIALTKKPILEQIAKLNMSLGGKGVQIQTPLGRVDQKIADSAQSSKGKVRNVQALLLLASPELLNKLRQGKAKISAELFRIQKGRVKQERLELAKQSAAKISNKNSNFELKWGICGNWESKLLTIPSM